MAKSRIGEKSTTKYNQIMTVIAYRNCNDIDVQFEDGTIVENKKYSEFKNGRIGNPNYFKNKFIGETNTAKNGQQMKIVDYTNAKNLTIEFEDGTVVTNKSYSHFRNGAILNPNYPNTKWSKDRIIRFANMRIGETRLANNGMEMTILEYRSSENVDIQFQDGTIVKNITYNSFQKGLVENPNYRIATSVSVNEYAVLYYLSAVGFRKSNKQELKLLGFGQMELDCYNPDLKIGIEYDGIWHNKKQKEDLIKNKLCADNNILLIRIREPSCNKLNSTSKDFYLTSKTQLSQSLECVLQEVISYINSVTTLHINIDIDLNRDRNDIFNKYRQIYKSSRVGQTSVANNGMLMTILEYRGTKDIDVQFEDGTIVKNTTYQSFKTGSIKNPNFVKLASVRVGEEKIANNGQKMKIVAYRGINDIDIQFEDGTVVVHRPYNYFKTGQIANPNFSKIEQNAMKRIGQTYIAKNGEFIKIIAYRNNTDIDVQFEDGTIVQHVRYDTFKSGKVCKNHDTK